MYAFTRARTKGVDLIRLTKNQNPKGKERGACG